MTFGPSSVFAGKKNEIKKESISRTASSSNMFSMLSSQNVETADAAAKCMIYVLLNMQKKLTLPHSRRTTAQAPSVTTPIQTS